MINAHIIIFLISVCGCQAKHFELWPINVGTVLFTRDDLRKSTWPKSDIGLLTARRYFQALIPPPTYGEIKGDFVPKMLYYFRDAYQNIKEQTLDPDADRILTTALSDTVGGYLKLWVLPITKIAYYGGVASFDDAFKAFKFYAEVKKYLATDGISWKKPDRKMLSAITLTIPKLVRRSNTNENLTESKKSDPCKIFTYFERSPDGSMVPMPVVNWDDSTMFLPMEDASTFSLDSPKHSYDLEKYYDKAKLCMLSADPPKAEEFDNKFEKWIANDILPHLQDDKLYVGLGNVLLLLNQTKAMCNYILDTYKLNDVSKTFAQSPHGTSLCSKTTIVVIIILLMELLWCTVAIDRMCCKNKTSDADFGARQSQTWYTDRAEIATSTFSFGRRWSKHSNATLTDQLCLQRATVESACQSPILAYTCQAVGAETKSTSEASIHCRVRSSDVFTIVNERMKDFRPGVLTRSNLSYTKVPLVTVPSIQNGPRDCYYKNKQFGKPASMLSRTKKEPSASTVFTAQKRTEGFKAVNRNQQGNAAHRDKNESERDNIPSVTNPSLPCVEEHDSHNEMRQLAQVAVSSVSRRAKTVSAVVTNADKGTETNAVCKKIKTAASFTKEKKPKQIRNRYLEIKIDRPKTNTAIKLGISASQTSPRSPRKGSSKIPTRKIRHKGQPDSLLRQSSKALHSEKELITHKAAVEYVDKSVNSAVVSLSEQSTDYTLNQDCISCHSSRKNRSKSTICNLNTSSMTLMSTATQLETNAERLLKKYEDSEKNSSVLILKKAGGTSAISALTSSLISDSKYGSDQNQTNVFFTKTCKGHERLIDTIYEHSKETLLSVLSSIGEEKVTRDDFTCTTSEKEEMTPGYLIHSLELPLTLNDSKDAEVDSMIKFRDCGSPTTQRKHRIITKINTQIPKRCCTLRSLGGSSEDTEALTAESKSLTNRYSENTDINTKSQIMPRKQKTTKLKTKIPKLFGNCSGGSSEDTGRFTAQVKTLTKKSADNNNTNAKTRTNPIRLHGKSSRHSLNAEDSSSRSYVSPRLKTTKIPKLKRSCTFDTETSAKKDSRLNISF